MYEKCKDNKDIQLYGIFIEKHHIGNILLMGLNSNHKRIEIGYVIGDKSYWGKGIATQLYQ